MSTWHYHSAEDLGLAGKQRCCSVHRETGLMVSGLRLVWLALAKTVLRVWNRWEIHGWENLPAQPPFVLVANHSSHLDAIVLAAVLPGRWRDQISPLAAGDYFFTSPPMAGFAAGILNALPLWRDRRGGQCHELADLRERLVSQSAIYIIFPEGSRSRDGQIHAFKPGFATLVAGTAIPVVPCHLEGNFAALPPERFWLRPRKIRLHIGPPMTFEATPNHACGWRQISAVLQEKTMALQASQSTAQEDHSRARHTKRRLICRLLRLFVWRQFHKLSASPSLR